MPAKTLRKPTAALKPRALKRNAFALASLVLGIFSFLNLAGFEKPLLAIAFGLLALRELARDPTQRGRGLAIAGIALGAIGLIAAAYALHFLSQSGVLECFANCTKALG